MMPSLNRFRSIDSSAVLFAVLMLCSTGGVFCAFHYGNTHEVERALLTLRERADDPQPRYLAAVIPEKNEPPREIEPMEGQMQPASYRTSSLAVTQETVERVPISAALAP